MNHSYRVKVNANTSHEFEMTTAELTTLDKTQDVNGSYHIIDNNASYSAEILTQDLDTKKYEVKVNNTIYQVQIADELDMKIEAMGFSVGTSKQIRNIKAPMPGLLLDILTKTGQEVNEDDPLLILEAMKMENVILSPRKGVIKSIHAEKGDALDKGQLMIEYE